MRLDKAVALAGLTRSEAKKAIAAGRVQVDGVAVRDAGMQVRPDQVRLDGAEIPGRPKPIDQWARGRGVGARPKPLCHCADPGRRQHRPHPVHRGRNLF